MSISKNFLNFFPISRVRRNHALEHASLQVLAHKKPHTAMAGFSDWHGITILGNISTSELHEAVEEARSRLKAGERQLAIHPHCGTNYATSGILAGFAAWLALLGSPEGLRPRARRLPLVITLVTLVFIISLPLGPIVQRGITTDSNIGELEVTEILVYQRAGATLHRIRTRY